MAFSPDGTEVVLSLVGAEHGTLADKQRPDSERDLDLYALDCETGSLRLLVEGPGDDLVTGVTDGALLWTTLQTSMRTCTAPLSGKGEAVEATGETSSYPYWHPDGDRISAMYGAFHVADWALNWDVGVVAVDADGRPLGALEPLVVGTYEDFAGVWSPDGRWIAPRTRPRGARRSA